MLTETKPPCIQLQNMQVYLEDIPLCDPVTLSLDSGTCLHIQGPNGIGKTKFLEALLGLYTNTYGTISIRGRICFVSTKQPFDDHRTVLENLTFWAGLLGHKDSEHITSLPSIRPILYKPFQSLSAGQKQIVNLALLSLKSGEIWILDEPVSFLDDDSRNTMFTDIKTFCARGGICIVTSHQKLPAFLDHQSLRLSVTQGTKAGDNER